MIDAIIYRLRVTSFFTIGINGLAIAILILHEGRIGSGEVMSAYGLIGIMVAIPYVMTRTACDSRKVRYHDKYGPRA